MQLEFKRTMAAIVLVFSFAAPVAADPFEDAEAAVRRLLGMGDTGRSTAMPRSLAAPVGTGPVEDGETAYRSGDYATALRLWRPMAERGDARAQFNLGVMYNNGRGVLQDYVIAHKWFTLAAAQGDKTAEEYRDVVARSIVPVQEAGVQRGVAGVQSGEAAYRSGNYSTALRLWLPLAERGDAAAQFNLGVMYNNGNGVPKDYTRAYMWFSLSAAGGDKTAAEYRNTVEQSMSQVQIAEAQKLAREWKPANPRKEPPTKTTTTGSRR